MKLGFNELLAENLERYRNRRLALRFWELRRAVTVATKETTVADGGFFAPFRLSRRQSSQRISFMLRKELYLLVICVNYFIGRAARCSPLTRRFIALVWFATLSLELISG